MIVFYRALLFSIVLTPIYNRASAEMPADLSQEQVEAIQLLLDLDSSNYFYLATDYDEWAKDFARECPRGGEVSVDDSSGKFEQKRIRPDTIELNASVDGLINAKACKLQTR